MVSYLILYRSITQAQRAARILERAGINCRVMRTPRSISTEGCGYCLGISERWLSKALVLLRQEPGKINRVYIVHDGDVPREVQL